MPELQQLDKSTLQLNDGFEDEQSENEDSNVEYNISVPDGIDGIPEGEDATLTDELSNIDNNMSEAYYSGSDQEDIILSTLNKNQLV